MLVRAGTVRAALTKDEALVCPIQEQVDMDMYSFEEQEKRWQCSQHPVFQGLCKELWNLAAEDQEGAFLDHDSYVELIFRFHYVCTPPPHDPQKVRWHLFSESDDRCWP